MVEYCSQKVGVWLMISASFAGDAALCELGSRLNGIADEFLCPYRFAGDEFILILKTGDITIGKKALSRCISIFDKPILLAGKPYTASGSFGVASCPQDAKSAEQLIICADNAMYYSKTHGKNMLSFYNALEEADKRKVAVKSSDEATSNTDIDFEVRFRQMLRERLADKTVILVTPQCHVLFENTRKKHAFVLQRA